MWQIPSSKINSPVDIENDDNIARGALDGSVPRSVDTSVSTLGTSRMMAEVRAVGCGAVGLSDLGPGSQYICDAVALSHKYL